MNLHMLTHLALREPQTSKLPNDLGEAIRSAAAENPDRKAILIMDGGSETDITGATPVAVFTPESGWVHLSENPFLWWRKLTPELRRSLAANPAAGLSPDEIEALTHAGATTSLAFWSDSDNQVHDQFMLPPSDQIFITAATRIGV